MCTFLALPLQSTIVSEWGSNNFTNIFNISIKIFRLHIFGNWFHIILRYHGIGFRPKRTKNRAQWIADLAKVLPFPIFYYVSYSISHFPVLFHKHNILLLDSQGPGYHGGCSLQLFSCRYTYFYSGNTWLCVHCQWTHNQVFLLLSHMLI